MCSLKIEMTWIIVHHVDLSTLFLIKKEMLAEMLISLYYVKFSEQLTNLQLTKVQPQPNHFTSDNQIRKG